MSENKELSVPSAKSGFSFVGTICREMFKVENKIILFIMEMAFFAVISILAGIAISYPIYSFGTEYAGFYKSFVSLGLVLLLFGMFIFRFIKNIREEKILIANSKGDLERFSQYIPIIYSFHKLFPRWIKISSQFIYFILKQLSRGIIILIIIYSFTIYGYLEKIFGVSGQDVKASYVYTMLIIITALFLLFGLVARVRESLQLYKEKRYTPYGVTLLSFKMFIKYIIAFTDIVIIYYWLISYGFDSLLKLAKIVWVFMTGPVTLWILPELPFWFWYSVFFLELVATTIIFESKSLIEKKDKSPIRLWFLLLSGGQLVFFYFCFFLLLTYNILQSF